MMDGVLGDFVQRVAAVDLHAPQIRYISNVSGTWITDRQATSPDYWGSHLRNTVRFADCGRNLLRDSNDVLLEVGPGDTLFSLLRVISGIAQHTAHFSRPCGMRLLKRMTAKYG